MPVIPKVIAVMSAHHCNYFPSGAVLLGIIQGSRCPRTTNEGKRIAAGKFCTLRDEGGGRKGQGGIVMVDKGKEGNWGVEQKGVGVEAGCVWKKRTTSLNLWRIWWLTEQGALHQWP